MVSALRLLIAVPVVCFFLASPASAAFEVGHLVQVIYNPAGVEIASDLGSLNSLDSASPQILGTTGGVNLSDYGIGDAWESLKIGFFGSTENGNWFATSTIGYQGVKGSGDDFIIAAGLSLAYYGFMINSTGDSTVKSDPNAPLNAAYDTFSYSATMNGNASGSYAGYNSHPGAGESSLFGLTTDGLVDMYLWQYDATTGEAVGDYPSGLLTLFIDANNNLFTQYSPLVKPPVVNPVPAPPALLLLFSGCLGLAGANNKNKRSSKEKGGIQGTGETRKNDPVQEFAPTHTDRF